VIPIGINPTTIGVSSAWWLQAARDAESAGFTGVWSWDHFVSRGRKTDAVLECWTTLTAAAAATTKLKVGSFINNVMNRHPSVLARQVATLWDQSGGRVELGIGVGGNEAEERSYGIPFPPPRERSAILEEAIAIIRLLWTGGPADFHGAHFELSEAYAYPAPQPAPRIIVGGEKPAGARLAARAGDGWTTNAAEYETLLPAHLVELEAHGRSRSDIAHLVAVSIDRKSPLQTQPLFADMATFLGEWHDRGADELIIDWVRADELPALLEAAARAGIGRSGP
jgi:alkanesulfonate monooxygenase SsuD/methylene tetrahydromethanopterin reductase-like flavin-dependent oxidoreductase (luciferase family)